jgi:hypothetical protein
MIPSRPVASPPVTNINPLIHPLPLIISPLLTSSLVNKLLSDPFFSPSPSRRRGLHSTADAVGPVRHQPRERRRIVRIPTWSFLWCQFTSPRLNYLMGCGWCWCWQADHMTIFLFWFEFDLFMWFVSIYSFSWFTKLSNITGNDPFIDMELICKSLQA